MRKDVFKNQNKGITLVALTVTIIVLIILASISLNLLLGNDGILKKTKDGRNNYIVSANEEEESLAKLYQDMGKYINGENVVDVAELDWEQIMQTATKHPQQHNTNDIGIGADGNPVNLDLWNYRISNSAAILNDVTGCGVQSCYVPYCDENAFGAEQINFNYSSISDNEYHFLILPKYIKVYGQENFVPVKKIGEFSFSICSDLYSVVIPDTIETIEGSVFSSCNQLTNVVFQNGLKYIGEYAFENCSSLTTMVLPESLIQVGKESFRGCNQLTNVVFQNGLENIGDNAFENCSSLTTMVLPESLTQVGKMIFKGCSNLKTVYIDSMDIVNELKKGLDLSDSVLESIYINENIYNTKLTHFTTESGITYVFNTIKNGYAEYVQGVAPADEGSEIGSE